MHVYKTVALILKCAQQINYFEMDLSLQHTNVALDLLADAAAQHSAQINQYTTLRTTTVATKRMTRKVHSLTRSIVTMVVNRWCK